VLGTGLALITLLLTTCAPVGTPPLVLETALPPVTPIPPAATPMPSTSTLALPTATVAIPVTSQPDLVNCKASIASRDCDSETHWIALPAPTGEMRVLYEDQRAIIFVNPESVSAGARNCILGYGRDCLELDEIFKLAESGKIAVYDRLQESCVTSVGEFYNTNTTNLTTIGGTPSPFVGHQTITRGLILPDCTFIIRRVTMS
jgi:hypothetical protein